MYEALVRNLRRPGLLALCTLLLATAAGGQDYTLPPVLLVPGYGGSGASLSNLQSYLTAHGYPAEFVRTIDLVPGDGPNQAAAEQQIAPAVETFLSDVNAFLATTSYSGPAKTKIAILGWSMGGFSSRWYATQVAPERVERWIGLAGANHGTQCACDLSCGIPPPSDHPNGLDDLCPPFSSNSGQTMQLTMNGAPGGAVDETPYGYGSDGAGKASVPPDATRAILYFAIRVGSETYVLPNSSAQIDGAGGASVTLPSGSPAQETSPGNFLLPNDDHISVGLSSTDAFALVRALLEAPVSTIECGDGVEQGGEACDEGMANGASTSCCNADCTLRSAGATCRPSSGVCDPAESCDGASGACPADVVGPDGDGDGICDAQDRCTNVGHGRDFASKPPAKLLLSKVNSETTPGNDKLVLVGSFTLPSTSDFGDLDPLARGARLVITTAQGGALLDGALPPGAYSGDGTRGWRTNAKTTVWQYLDKTSAPLFGILALKAKDAGHGMAGGRVRVLVKGRNGTYSVAAGNEPLQATVVLGDQSDAIAGRCGESAYGAGDCAFNHAQNALTCRR